MGARVNGSLRTADVERTLRAYLGQELGADVRVHVAGEMFDGKDDQWVEPRIVRVERAGSSRPGEENDILTVAVICYQRRGIKGARFATLSTFADAVREVVDSTAGAGAMQVRNEGGRTLALLIFGNAQESRTFNTTVNVEGVGYSGVDVATLSVRCVWTRVAAGYNDAAG